METISIAEFLNQIGALDYEKEVIEEINQDLKSISKEFLIELKDKGEINCARIYYQKGIIQLIKEEDGYSSLLHELLHAKFCFIKKLSLFESFHKPNTEGKKVFFRDKPFISELHNDFHHISFYQEWKNKTSHLTNEPFLSNESQMISLSETDFPTLNHGLKRKKQGSLEQLVEFYRMVYQKIIYRELLLDDKCETIRKMFLKEFSECMAYLDTFFNTIKSQTISQNELDEALHTLWDNVR